MKKLLLLLTIGLSCLNINAQHKFCGTDEFMKVWLDNHPDIKAEYLKRDAADAAAALTGANDAKINPNQTATTIYTIPVVFHILHLGGGENISDAQVKDAIRILNVDYHRQNPDTTAVITQFKSNIADVNFQFALATRDPNGNCTTGIIRHYTTGTDWIGNLGEYIYTWPSNAYLNVYVVRSIAPQNGFQPAGYTYLPGTVSAAEDAIILLHDYIGSIGTGNPFTSRAFGHEVGHWFNLKHVWGSTNAPGIACGDDNVTDTPITKGYSYCPGGAPAICNATITENYQNYMEYSYCSHMFTNGQGARMTTCITGGTMGRNQLWSGPNLNATGVTNSLSACAPMADFSIPTMTVCSGIPVLFKDYSYNGTVTAWSWAASGTSTISASSANVTNITFGTPGIQTVSLTVSNSTGSSTATKTITVLNGFAQVGFTKSESFEGATTPQYWSVIDPSGGVSWAVTTPAAATGLYSFWMHNYGLNPNLAVDILETPSYNFASDPNSTFTFKYAYAKKDAANADIFKVQASGDCGGTWTDIWTPSNTVLSTGSGGVDNNEFFPTPAQFKTYTLTNHPGFGPFKLMSNVRIRFYFQEDPSSGFGNNFYLDDINYKDTTVEINDIGIHELSKYINFNLYPNPTNGSSTIEFTLSENSGVKYHVCDVTGRVVEAEKNFNFEPGTHTVIVNQNQKLKSGVYFVNFDLNKQRISRKLIIE